MSAAAFTRRVALLVALVAGMAGVTDARAADAAPAPGNDCRVDGGTSECMAVRLEPRNGPPGTEVTVSAESTCAFPTPSRATLRYYSDPDLGPGRDEPAGPSRLVGTLGASDMITRTFTIPDDAEGNDFFEVTCDNENFGGGGGSTFTVTEAQGGAAPEPSSGDSFGGDLLEVSPDDGEPGEVSITALEISCGEGDSVLRWYPEYVASGPNGFFEGRGEAVDITTLEPGEMTDVDFEIPDDAPATSAFATTCPDGTAPVHRFAVVGDPVYDPSLAGPDIDFDLPHNRSSFPRSVPAPGDVSTDGGLIVTNLVLALLMLLLVFPAELFNATLEEHYDDVAKWLRGPRSLLERVNHLLAQRGAKVGFLLVTAATAVLYGFLDPNVALDEATIAMVLGVGGAIGVAVLIGGWASRHYLRRAHDDAGALKVYPAALIVALVCVLISRLADFQPGYLYGIVAGFAFTAQLSKDDEGKTAAFAGVAGLAASLFAWIAWIPVRDSANDFDPNIVVLILDSFLAAMFVGGLQALVFGFVPIRFLPGAKVWAWSKRAWAALFAVGAFGFLHVLLHPSEDYEGSLTTMIVLFVGFALASGVFWAYFRYRKPPTTPEPGDPDEPDLAEVS